jgi:hypothetical protein
MLYDRWRSIESVVASGGLSGSIVLDGIGQDLVPDDMIGDHRLFVEEEWNHFVYAEILERVGGSRPRADFPCGGPCARPAILVTVGELASRALRSL